MISETRIAVCRASPTTGDVCHESDFYVEFIVRFLEVGFGHGSPAFTSQQLRLPILAAILKELAAALRKSQEASDKFGTQ